MGEGRGGGKQAWIEGKAQKLTAGPPASLPDAGKIDLMRADFEVWSRWQWAVARGEGRGRAVLRGVKKRRRVGKQ